MSEPKKRIRKTSYVFTINNPTPEDFGVLEMFINDEKFRYMVYQGEIGHKRGVPHLQGYMEFNRAVDLTVIKKMLPRAHLEIRKGTRDQARHYCLKPCADPLCKSIHCITERAKNLPKWLLPVEFGVFKQDSGSSYWAEALRYVEMGLSDFDILQVNPNYLAQIKAIRDYRREFERHQFKGKTVDVKKDMRDVKVIYIKGITGVGKTYSVVTTYPDVYVASAQDKNSFDMYAGQPVILLDEYTDERKIQYWLRLLDRYPVQIPCRYQNQWLAAELIFVVSNINFVELYECEDEKIVKAFRRRFSAVITMKSREEFYEVGTKKTYRTLSETVKNVQIK